MKKTILALSFIFLVGLTTQGFSQEKKFHAVFIYNFYKNIEWPASYRGSDFVIGILGQSPVTALLQEMTAGRSAGAHSFVIKEYGSLSEIDRCHMLFIPENKSSQFDAVLRKFTAKPTLIITEKPGLGGRGSGINFVQVNDRLKFELNESALSKANLKVSHTLRTLAILI